MKDVEEVGGFIISSPVKDFKYVFIYKGLFSISLLKPSQLKAKSLSQPSNDINIWLKSNSQTKWMKQAAYFILDHIKAPCLCEYVNS